MGLLAREEARRLVAEFLAVRGNDAANAWLAVYQALLWYETVGGVPVPHIMEVSALRGGAWRKRAEEVNSYLATALALEPHEVPHKVDRLLSLPNFVGQQRQNPLGQGFVGAIHGVLSALGARDIDYRTEVPSTDFFPGIRIPGRTTIPKIDLAALHEDRLVAVLSAKWSLRHDRLNDITNECPVYKEAAFRHWRRHPYYYVVTNEFSPARLRRLVEDPCVDAVIHVHAALVTEVCGLDIHVADLADLIRLTSTW
jgi:hypothetical protein